MALRTSVKVGSITNLSDARYCSGMGVDMLGFRTMEGHEKYISPALFQEISGWFSGPKVVAELYGIQNQQQLTQVLKDYRPELIELSLKELTALNSLSLPAILSLTHNEYQQHRNTILQRRDQFQHLMLSSETETAHIIELAKEFPILLKLHDALKPELLELPVHGIALEGSAEDKPGLKSYESLAEVLELLEQE